ncbi:MAG: hypothetical protein ABIA47_04780 [bacterium]
MMLYVNGQDIEHVIIGVVGMEKEIPLRIVDVGPEQFLKALDKFLSDAKKGVRDIKKIFAVVGPGSPTALRTILTILNTISFVQGAELYAVEKKPHEQDIDTLRGVKEKKIPTSKVRVLEPIYTHRPKITLSTKDRLGR